ncbi:MFS transporter [Kangiella sediminilitoris]|uniref:1-acyl-sn-glycerol-3-phosphate acyltransferase n=1 Tax=Kangiella sediminilitoris TaxID=1144748 RepID=A0A1B3B8C9_9GAMM|nr:MFS transporter [Kangiella sediminilitoris]AOE49059.1 1-acyl-sn-glycerol-3-phosphate acyltransferase [Kangiella sediminilitoris]
MAQNQFSLFKQKFFSSFFITQALGALNDNIYKSALLIFIAFRAGDELGLSSDLLNNIAAGLFILPFFIFSATAGQVAEKYEKSALIRKIKLLEITIMSLAVLGFFINNIWFLLGILFLMGFQSSLFGPIKYSILPQHLSDKELLGGNGMVEMGTFLSIIIGTVIGGMLIGFGDTGIQILCVLLLVVSITGYLSSRHIPQTPSAQADLKINWNPISETWKTFHYARTNRVVFLSILGISWFWFYGAVFLTQIPNFTKVSLNGNENVATMILATFSIGIGLGSALCEFLSGRKVELGLVPFGAIGMTWFALDIYFANPYSEFTGDLGALNFLIQEGAIRTLVNCAFVGIFGGFYIVPLYALVQERCEKNHLSRVIAGNNILNAFFMVIAALLAAVCLGNGMTIPQFFMLTAILNAVVALYIFTLIPEFLMRFLIWILINTIYRVKKSGIENIPEEGPCVVVSNHVSYVDALIIGGTVRRPIRFVMYHKIFKIPVLSFIFRTAKAIPIAGHKENPELLNKAMYQISEALDQGEVVCIFPEGKLTSDGEMNDFKSGIERILKETPVPVVPMALQGLWQSLFSRKTVNKLVDRVKRLRTKVRLVVGKPIPADEATKEQLYTIVSKLRNNKP